MCTVLDKTPIIGIFSPFLAEMASPAMLFFTFDMRGYKSGELPFGSVAMVVCKTLDANHITGTLPPELAQMTSLAYL